MAKHKPLVSTSTSSRSELVCITTLTPPLKKLQFNASAVDIALAEYSSRSLIRQAGPAWQCTFSNDGSQLASCHGAPDACVRVWNLFDPSQKGSEWMLTATLRSGEAPLRTIRSLAFSPVSNRILATAGFDGTIAVWESFSSPSKAKKEENYFDRFEEEESNTNNEWECTAQLEGHENEVKCVVWNATGTLLATCGRDKSAWIWECLLAGTIGGSDSSTIGEGGGSEFECIAVLHGHTGDVKSLEFAPSHGQWGDGDEILLSASYDDTIKCWAEDAGDWFCAATLSAQTSTTWSIAVAPGGVRFVTGAGDGSLAFWRCYTASEKRRLFPETVTAGGSTNGMWKCVGKLPSAHELAVYSVHCAPSRVGHGRITSCGADNRINIYREVGGTSDAPLFALDAFAKMAHDGDVNCIRWHPKDGTLLASAGDDGLVKIWKYSLDPY